jgi:hypothetical protein
LARGGEMATYQVIPVFSLSDFDERRTFPANPRDAARFQVSNATEEERCGPHLNAV